MLIFNSGKEKDQQPHLYFSSKLQTSFGLFVNGYVYTDIHVFYRFFSYKGNFETTIQGESFVNHVDVWEDVRHRGLAKSTQIPLNRWCNKNDSLTFASWYLYILWSQRCSSIPARMPPQHGHNSYTTARVKQRCCEHMVCGTAWRHLCHISILVSG